MVQKRFDRHKVSVNQFRFGTEFLRSITWANGLTLLPFGEVHVRRDGGAEETGIGMEVIGGSRLSAGRIWVDAQGALSHTAFRRKLSRTRIGSYGRS